MEHQTCAPEEAPDAEESIDNRVDGFICLVEQRGVKKDSSKETDRHGNSGRRKEI